MATLLIIDLFALLYRLHFARYNQLSQDSAEGVRATLSGFVESLLSARDALSPTHILVVMDGASNKRKEQYEGYKKHREKQPEGITDALPGVYAFLEALHIPIIHCEGYEADDLMGFFAKQAEGEGATVYLLTSDKDMGQIVSDRIFLYRPSGSARPMERWGVEEVNAYWGIRRPNQIPDMIGLWGDSSDGIPGVPGIGRKTASALLQRFDDLKGVLAAAGSMGDRIGKQLMEHAEQARLSRDLAQLAADIPLSVRWDSGPAQSVEMGKLHSLCAHYGLKKLQRRFAPAMDRPTIPSLFDVAEVPASAGGGALLGEVVTLTTPGACAQLVQRWADEPAFAFMLHTAHMDLKEHVVPQHVVLGVVLAADPFNAYHIPLTGEEVADAQLWQALAPLFASDRYKVGYQLKYDLRLLKQVTSIVVQPPFFDLQIAAQLLFPQERVALARLAQISSAPISAEPAPLSPDHTGDGPSRILLPDVLSAVKHCVAAYRALSPALEEAQLHPLFHDTEMRLLPVLADMEEVGIRVDSALLQRYQVETEAELDRLEKEVYAQAGGVFNLSSPKQLGHWLYERLALMKRPPKTKTGLYATDEQTLQGLLGVHPMVEPLLSYRALKKLLSTYIEGLPPHISRRDQRIHTWYEQGVVTTGRLSSLRPNLQNIPVRTERGRDIRRAFTATDAEHRLLSADYAQIELRVLAHCAGDAQLISILSHGGDPYRLLAAELWGIGAGSISAQQRHIAKTANLSIVYGVSAFTLAQQLHVSRAEAEQIIHNYFQRFPTIREYIASEVQMARERGYVCTFLGRRRWLPDIDSRNQTIRKLAERNAINTPIQGSAAEIIKQAMVRVADWIADEGMRTRLVLQVHDELLFDVPTDELSHCMEHIPRIMEGAFQLKVPLLTRVAVGNNWAELH